jgi:hypothetical protein
VSGSYSRRHHRQCRGHHSSDRRQSQFDRRRPAHWVDFIWSDVYVDASRRATNIFHRFLRLRSTYSAHGRWSPRCASRGRMRVLRRTACNVSSHTRTTIILLHLLFVFLGCRVSIARSVWRRCEIRRSATQTSCTLLITSIMSCGASRRHALR